MLFGVAPASDMFQKKIDKPFNGMFNVCSILDDILISGFDELGRDHDMTLDKVLRICKQANMKVSRDNCLLDVPASFFQ